MTYKLVKNPITNKTDETLKRTVDGIVSYVPYDPANTDYQTYLKWVDEGNTPEAAD
tara:strand:- start:453 stop:620 length:168 start_codon:yes stop_codon:yes gene_type:complete